MRVYGRTRAPEIPCVVASAEDSLSDAILLRPDEAQEIVTGGPVYGKALAELITTPPYYLGASLEGGVLLSTEERILLENGEISVYF